MDDNLDVLALLRAAVEHPDTGLRLPKGLAGTKTAAYRTGMSESTLRRRCREDGLGFLIGKTWFVVEAALDAFQANDTGIAHDYQRDIQLVRKLTGWPVSALASSEAQIMPIKWLTADQEAGTMEASIAPAQRYNRTLRLKIPESMESALQYVARRRLQSTSGWVRQVLLSELQREGLSITDTGVIIRRGEDL